MRCSLTRAAARPQGQSPPLAGPQLAPLRLLRARLVALAGSTHSQGEPRPLGTQPLPRVLELAASKAASFTAFDHVGTDHEGGTATLRYEWNEPEPYP